MNVNCIIGGEERELGICVVLSYIVSIEEGIEYIVYLFLFLKCIIKSIFLSSFSLYLVIFILFKIYLRKFINEKIYVVGVIEFKVVFYF